MRQLPTALVSVPLLVAASVALLGGSIAAVLPASRFIAERSTDTTTNLYLVGGLTLLAALAAGAEALLVIRLVWGAEALAGEAVRRRPRRTGAPGQRDDDDDGPAVGALKVTGTKKTLVMLVALAVNILVLDQIGAGVLVTRTRSNHVLTLLRSESAADRRVAAGDAIQLVGEARIARALGLAIERPGAAREWAAYAAGVRHDGTLKEPLAGLLRTGTPVERAGAAAALARLEDPRLLRLALDALPGAGEHRKDLLIAIGMLGKRRDVTADRDLAEAGTAIAGLARSGDLGDEELLVAIWTLGRIEAPEGLEYLEGLLKPATDPRVLCPALEALGNIGAADTSPKLLELVGRVDRELRCPEIVAADFTGHEVLLCGGLDLVQRILREIARIGDRRAQGAMDAISKDESHTEIVRKMAAEIAYQMRFVPVTQE
ncbi:MAG TPA: HEAT repeat domain-containing protein [Polyangia bacterium]|nr:HEAT repeat domain-containing protein [Polyangia bacterium]